MDCSSSIDYCSRCRILLQLLFLPHESEWTIWKCILTCELEWLVLNYLYLYIYTVCPDSCTVCPSVHFECVESMHWPVRHVGSVCVLALHRITYIYARGDFLTFKKQKKKKERHAWWDLSPTDTVPCASCVGSFLWWLQHSTPSVFQ